MEEAERGRLGWVGLEGMNCRAPEGHARTHWNSVSPVWEAGWAMGRRWHQREVGGLVAAWDGEAEVRPPGRSRAWANAGWG